MAERELLNQVSSSIIGAAIEVHRALALACWSPLKKLVWLLNWHSEG